MIFYETAWFGRGAVDAGNSPVALALTGATVCAVGSPDKAQPHPGYSLSAR